MESPSPYQTPAGAPPPMPYRGFGEPPAVKVFGIIHLILAGLGFLMGIWHVVSPYAQNLFHVEGSPGYDAQMQIQSDLLWVTVLSGVFTLILAVLLLIAGLALVKGRKEGVKWSRLYSWISIGTKAVMLFITVAWVMPRTQQMMGEIMKSGGSSGAAESGMITAMNAAVAAFSIGSPLIACIYPALALFFLSRPAVSAWCGVRPSDVP